MIEFLIESKEFKKAIRLLLVGRKEYMDQDLADFITIADDLELCSTGTSTHMNCLVIQAGYARVPLPVLVKIRKIATSFKDNRLRVKIELGRIKVQTFSFSHPAIELKRIGPRIADVPVNASILDTLAMQKLYSAEELAESGLAARVLEAQEKASSAVEHATLSLSDFGIGREALRELLDMHVLLHAKALKAVMRDS